MLRPIHLGALLIWQGGGILRLDNEDCTLLQQTIDLLEDIGSCMLRPIHLGALLIWQGGGILRLDNEDCSCYSKPSTSSRTCACERAAQASAELLWRAGSCMLRPIHLGALLTWACCCHGW